MQAVGGNILVQEDVTPTVTKGGVHLPETARATMDRGDVLSVGSRVTGVRPGERVLYTPYVGEELKIKGPDGEALVVLREEQIVGVIVED